MSRHAKAPSIGMTLRHGGIARGTFGLVYLCVLGLSVFFGSNASTVGAAEIFPGQGFLPNNRAWEMVSPPDKFGGQVVSDARRTRAAVDGNAVGFHSLQVFSDAIGTSISVDYISQRSGDPAAGGNGWSTHAITPKRIGTTFKDLVQGLDAHYTGEFSDDLRTGIFFSSTPITDDPNVALAYNFYLRDDLRTPGSGSYELLTRCSLCEQTETPLLPTPDIGRLAPQLADATPDFGRVIFESERRLTPDAPASSKERFLYEWSGGAVSLVGRIPSGLATECDDLGGPACVAAPISVAGQGTGYGMVGPSNAHDPSLTPHTLSDGSDGHSRAFFTHPFDASKASDPNSYEGNLYLREDGHHTVQLNNFENPPLKGSPRARFLDASSDGTRAFFRSSGQLTVGAPSSGTKLYMYDASKPGSAPDNLTRISIDAEPSDGINSFGGLIGLSSDGRDVYFLADGQLVAGGPVIPGGGFGIYHWRDGAISYVGYLGSGLMSELLTSGPTSMLIPRLARVTPDGRHLLFTASKGEGLTSYDHGSCAGASLGCREFYLYSADTNTLQCASCNPSGEAATVNAEAAVRDFRGGTVTSTHEAKTLSIDGRYVFFSTAEQLVEADTNGVSDAYLFDAFSGEPHLLSSGTDPDPSYFLDASADGRDAFFTTAEQLSGWDGDSGYDLYDARVGGGFSEPLPMPPACTGEACQPEPSPPADATPGSATLIGPGDLPGRVPCPAGKRRVGSRCVKPCPAGKHRVERRGESRCVKPGYRGGKKANQNRRAGR